MEKEKLRTVPEKPGVYIFKGKREKVLYVGKAKNLKNRISSYFSGIQRLDDRKALMVNLIEDFSFIVTENELEALVLEANLIKQYKPRFNVILRDDKNYPYLKLTVNEEWPRLEVVRRITKDGSLYFGPYVPAQSMWEALAFIRRNFPIRVCDHQLDKPMRPCIQYEIGRCGAPCAGAVTRKGYMKIVEEIRLFLSGKRKELLKNLEREMLRLSDELKFEEAARIRDRIRNIEHAWESQRVVAPELGDIDVIGFYTDHADAVFDIFFVRNGVLVGTKDFYVRGAGSLPRGEALHSFIEMFYQKEILPPREILLGYSPIEEKNLRNWLEKKKGGKVIIKVPKAGRRRDLLIMANENAAQVFNRTNVEDTDELMKDLQKKLRLTSLPGSIGAFDVSTIAGRESVGAFVYWSEGNFVKDMYRHLRVKGVSGIDDYAMMKEVIWRTLDNLADRIPDLILIDGGKGQLDVAREVVEARGTTKDGGGRPELVAVAKDPDRAITLSGDTVTLEDGSRSSLLLKKIRDEAHRFAVTYHRRLRDKRLRESILEGVRGIGKKRRLELLRYFGSIDSIRNATIEEVAALKGFNTGLAKSLLREIRRQ